MQDRLNPEKTRAILVGTSEFKDFNNISAVDNNIDEFEKVLANKKVFGLLSNDNIKIIKNPNDQELKSKLIQYTETAKTDDIKTLIVYFAGHGFRTRDGKYFLATKNSEKQLIRVDGSSALAYDTVKKIFQTSQIPQIIIFIDACYSGAAAQGEGEDAFNEYKAKGTYTITSSDSTELSYYDTDAKHTIFSGELLNIFNYGISDNETEQISLSNLYTELQTAVKGKKKNMSPQKLASKEITGENFLLCKNIKFDKYAIKRKYINKQIRSADKYFEDLDFSKAENIYSRARRKIEAEKIEITDKTITYLDKRIEDCERILDYEIPFREKYKNDYENQIVNLEKQILTLKEQKVNTDKDYKLKVTDLNNKNTKYADGIKKLNNLINVEKEKNDVVKKQLNEGNKINKELNGKIKLLEEELKNKEKKYTDKREEAKELHNELINSKEQANIKISKYEKDILKSNDNTTQLQNNISNLQLEIKQLKEKIQTLNDSKHELHTEINNLKKSQKQGKETIVEKEEEIRVIKELNEELTSEISKSRNEYETKSKTIEKKITQLQKELQEKSNDNKLIRIENRKLQKQVSDLSKDIVSKDSEIATHKKNIAQFTDEEKQGNKNDLLRLQTENLKLIEQVEEDKKIYEKNIKTIKAKQKQIDENNRFKKKNNEIYRENQKEIANLKKELTTLKSEKEKFLNALKEDAKIFHKNQEEIKKLKTQLNSTNLLKIGQKHAGGIIFYIDKTGKHGFVCAEQDQGKSFWCENEYETINTKSNIGNGKENTKKIISKYPNKNTAAKICDNLTLNGYNDWFLPSKNELNLLFLNILQHGDLKLTDKYWSSTEYNVNSACYFGYDIGYIEKKSNVLKIRAIRAF